MNNNYNIIYATRDIFVQYLILEKLTRKYALSVQVETR